MAIGGPLATALDAVWESIRARHPDVPDVVVAMASGSQGRGRGLRLGHFGPARWERRGVWLPELFVGAEGLTAGAREVVATLLHQAAHGLADVRQISEASDNGRYHNKKFRLLAQEVGLSVARHERLGWSLTTVPNATASTYARELEELQRAIVAHRRPEYTDGDSDPATADPEHGPDVDGESTRKSNDRNGQPLTCACAPPRRIRAHKKIVDAGPILCGLCREPFSR